MSSLLERLAEKLAEDAVEQVRLTGDEGIIEAVAKSLADTSTTFKDTFLTCVRYIQAEERARLQALPNHRPQPDGSRPAGPEDAAPRPEPAVAAPAPRPAPAAAPATGDDGYADVEYLDDEPKATQPKAPSKPATGQGLTASARERLANDLARRAETPRAEPEITEPRKRGH